MLYTSPARVITDSKFIWTVQLKKTGLLLLLLISVERPHHLKLWTACFPKNPLLSDEGQITVSYGGGSSYYPSDFSYPLKAPNTLQTHKYWNRFSIFLNWNMNSARSLEYTSLSLSLSLYNRVSNNNNVGIYRTWLCTLERLGQWERKEEEWTMRRVDQYYQRLELVDKSIGCISSMIAPPGGTASSWGGGGRCCRWVDGGGTKGFG